MLQHDEPHTRGPEAPSPVVYRGNMEGVEHSYPVGDGGHCEEPEDDDLFVAASSSSFPVLPGDGHAFGNSTTPSQHVDSSTRAARATGSRTSALRDLLTSRREQTLRWLSSSHSVRQTHGAGAAEDAVLAPRGSSQHVHVYKSIASDAARVVASFIFKAAGGSGTPPLESVATDITALPSKIVSSILAGSSKLPRATPPSPASSPTGGSQRVASWAQQQPTDLPPVLPACMASTASPHTALAPGAGDPAAQHAKVRDNIRNMLELCLIGSVYIAPGTWGNEGKTALLSLPPLPRVQAALLAAELEEEAWRLATGRYARSDRAAISAYEKRCRTTIHNLREQSYSTAVLALVSGEIDAAAFLSMDAHELLKFSSSKKISNRPASIAKPDSVALPIISGAMVIAADPDQRTGGADTAASVDAEVHDAADASARSGLLPAGADTAAETEGLTALSDGPQTYSHTAAITDPVITVPDFVTSISVPAPLGQLFLAEPSLAPASGIPTAKPKFVASVMSLLHNSHSGDIVERETADDSAVHASPETVSVAEPSPSRTLKDATFGSFESFLFDTCSESFSNVEEKNDVKQTETRPIYGTSANPLGRPDKSITRSVHNAPPVREVSVVDFAAERPAASSGVTGMWLDAVADHLQRNPTANGVDSVLTAIPLPVGATWSEVQSAMGADTRFQSVHVGRTLRFYLKDASNLYLSHIWADNLVEHLITSHVPVPLSRLDSVVRGSVGGTLPLPQKLSYILADKRFEMITSGNEAVISLSSFSGYTEVAPPPHHLREETALRGSNRASYRVSRSRSRSRTRSRSRSPRSGGHASRGSSSGSRGNARSEGPVEYRRWEHTSTSRSRTRSRSRSPGGFRHRNRDDYSSYSGREDSNREHFRSQRDSPPSRRGRKRSLSRSSSPDRHRQGQGQRAVDHHHHHHRGGRDAGRHNSHSQPAPRASSYYVPEGSSSDSDDGVDVKTKLDAIMAGSVSIGDGIKRHGAGIKRSRR